MWSIAGCSMPAPLKAEIFHGRIANVTRPSVRMIAVRLALDVAALELEHVAIEVRHAARPARAREREVADRVVLLPLALGIDLGAVLVALLRQVEIVAGRIVRAVARERAVAGPLHDLDVGIFLRYLLAHLVEVLRPRCRNDRGRPCGRRGAG